MVVLGLQSSFDGYHIFLGDHTFQEKTTVEVYLEGKIISRQRKERHLGTINYIMHFWARA